MDMGAIQAWVAGLIRANATIVSFGDIAAAAMATKRIVLEDDGTYPKTEFREEVLQTKGLCIVVWEIQCNGLEDVSRAGTLVPEIYVPIVIEENVKVNQATGGTGLCADDAVQLVLAATCGRRPVANSNSILTAFDPPWRNLGTNNGIRQRVVNLAFSKTIVPA